MRKARRPAGFSFFINRFPTDRTDFADAKVFLLGCARSQELLYKLYKKSQGFYLR